MFRTALVLALLSPSAALACGMRKPAAVMLASAFEDIDTAEAEEAPEPAPAEAEPAAVNAATADAEQPEAEAEPAEAAPAEPEQAPATPEREPSS